MALLGVRAKGSVVGKGRVRLGRRRSETSTPLGGSSWLLTRQEGVPTREIAVCVRGFPTRAVWDAKKQEDFFFCSFISVGEKTRWLF